MPNSIEFKFKSKNNIIYSNQAAMKFYNMFCKILTQNVDEFTQIGILALSVSSVLKIINCVYFDKINFGKESVVIKMQSVFEYLYGYYMNLYGVSSFSEKKLMELLLSVIKNSSIPRIQLFARFLNLSNIHYSADDFEFFFDISLLFQGVNSQFESPLNGSSSRIALDIAFELMRQFFGTRSSIELIEARIKKVF